MTNMSIFKRGQIWHWDDPIYKKDGPNKIKNGEATLRYSRYVLILQNIEGLIGKGAPILVAPLTTIPDAVDTTTVTIALYNENKPSWIKLNHIMPVTASHLSNYIGTLEGETMQEVDNKIREVMLAPTLKTVELNLVQKESKKIAAKAGSKKKGKDKGNAWTSDRIAEFVTFYKTNGPMETAVKFNITNKSASSYYHKWKDIKTIN